MDKKYFYISASVLVLIIVAIVVNKTSKIKSESDYQSLQNEISFATITPEPVVTNMEELKIEDIKVGTGAAAGKGNKVTVNYVGTLTDGTKFDSSYDRNLTFSFNLGAGDVIQGWDQGVVGMKVGGKRKLTIPSSLGYGASGAGGVIPPNATLIFEIELLKVD